MAEKTLSRTIGGKYRLRSVLGKGAMGIVYRAEQLDAEGQPLREVALKMPQDDRPLDVGLAKRLLREIRVLANLRGPHVVTLYDAGEDEEGRPYYTMELVRGRTLKEVLEQEGILPVERVVNIVEQVCEALAEAHSLPQPVVHRDLKPGNIFLEEHKEREWVKVGDFGIAKVLGAHTIELTGTGSLLGTGRYMAPEQWRGEEVDGRTDLYALGIMMYTMLTGSPPFSAPTIEALMYKHLHEPPPPLPASIPVEIRTLVEQLLAKAPQERPADARKVRQALEVALVQDEEKEESTILLSAKQAAKPAEVAHSQPGDVFVSYSSRDREQVLDIARQLESAGVRVRMDRGKANDDMNSGQETIHSIEGCKVLLVMCSNASLRSQAVKAEMQLAWQYQRPYLPLLLE